MDRNPCLVSEGTIQAKRCESVAGQNDRLPSPALHDARVFVGEINLIARQRPLGWKLGRLAAALFARGRSLGVASAASYSAISRARGVPWRAPRCLCVLQRSCVNA